MSVPDERYAHRVRESIALGRELNEANAHIAELERSAESWKLACELFERLMVGSTQLVKMSEEDADMAAHNFLYGFEALKLLHGDPTKATPMGTIDFKERP